MLKRRASLWILKQSSWHLLGLWAALYVITAAIFTIYYKWVPGALLDSNKRIFTPSFEEALYFSLTTQATGGFGEMIPAPKTHFVATTHQFLGLTLVSVALGIYLYKLLRPGIPVRFSDRLVYDPKFHNFWFRFYDYDSDDLRNIELGVTIFERDTRLGYSTVVSWVVTDYTSCRWMPTAHLFALRTKTNEGKHEGTVGDEAVPLVLSPTHITPGSIVRLDISGHFHSSGDQFFANQDYTLATISCGDFHPVDSPDLDHYAMSKRARITSDLLNIVRNTKPDFCRKCAFFNTCPLDVASSLRK
jgi:hypothetical protein